jgi:hypothetical protein
LKKTKNKNQYCTLNFVLVKKRTKEDTQATGQEKNKKDTQATGQEKNKKDKQGSANHHTKY